MYYYTVYGIQIQSEIEIEAFQEVKKFTSDLEIYTIEKAEISFEGHVFIDDFVIREYTDNGFLYVIKDIVAILITENRMKICPLIESRKVWQSFLVGGAMSVVLIQKGFFLLHGSAVQFKDSACLFLGRSGVGKSSLATGLGQLGYTIITDDICAISNVNNDLFISAGTKQVRLLKDAVESLNIKTATALDHPTTQPKFGYNFNRKPTESKTKVVKIVELVVDESMKEEICMERIDSFGKIELLKANVYKEDLANTLKAHTQNFQFMMLSANGIDCLRIRRKKKNYSLKKLVDLIDQNL
jgi:hypothetical protein